VEGLLGKPFRAAQQTIEDYIEDYEVTDCGRHALLRLTGTFTAQETGDSTRARVVEPYRIGHGGSPRSTSATRT
jgi:hypothetical protein